MSGPLGANGERQRNSLDGITTSGTGAAGVQHVEVASSSGVRTTASRLERLLLIHRDSQCLPGLVRKMARSPGSKVRARLCVRPVRAHTTPTAAFSASQYSQFEFAFSSISLYADAYAWVPSASVTVTLIDPPMNMAELPLAPVLQSYV